jgi:outer membrane lipoprotein-sorting protein
MHMKKLLIIILSFLSTGILMAQDIKLEELLDKYYKAIGQDKIIKAQTMKMTGKIFQMGMEMTMTIIKKRPNLSRTEVDVQGTKIVFAVDGENGWMIMPFTGSSDPQDMPADQLNNTKKEDMDGPFFNWKEKGNMLELVGKEDMEGTPVYNVKITSKDSTVANYYMDATKFVILKMKAKVMSQGQMADVETKFSDFREANGIQNAYKIETMSNGQAGAQITFDTFEYDVPMDNAIFKRPAADAK